MTLENWIAIFGIGITWSGLIIKIILDSRKKMSCPLDRSQTIYKVNTMEEKMDKISARLEDLKLKAEEGIGVAHRNGQYGEKTTELLQASAIYMKNLLEQQKKTNEILEAIRINGNGRK